MISLYFLEFDTSEMSPGVIRRTEHRMGRLLLFKVLREFYGISTPKIGVTAKGKPYLEDESVFFNLSHSDGKIVLAVSDRPVGVDIERADRSVSAHVSKKYFDGKPATAGDWTRLESYFKYTGEGLFSFSNVSPEKEVFFRMYDDVPLYVIAICSECNEFPSGVIRIENAEETL